MTKKYLVKSTKAAMSQFCHGRLNKNLILTGSLKSVESIEKQNKDG